MTLLDDFKGTFLFTKIMIHHEVECIIYMTFYKTLQDFQDTGTSGIGPSGHTLTYLLFCAIWVGGPFLYQDPLLLLSCSSSSSLSFHYCPLFGRRCHQCPNTQRQLACEMISEAQGCSQDYSYRRSQLFQSDGERDGERLSHTLDLVTLVG